MKHTLLKSAIALAISAGSMQAHAATATYDPATKRVEIPVVDVRDSANFTPYTAILELQGNKLVVVGANSAVAKTGARGTYDTATKTLHLPSVKVLGSNNELYAKLKVIPGSNPLAFSIDQLVPTSFQKCPDFSVKGPIANSCVIKGSAAGIQKDVTLTANTTWILSGGVYIGGDNKNSATITINPGTQIFGQSGNDFLYIRRGSKIMAEGTPDQPIVMTGPNEVSRGEWGGLLIAGNAKVNGCAAGVTSCQPAFEAITSEQYGGTNDKDNSGVLKYVQIKYAGFAVRPNQELNGLTLMGVGSGTLIDFVQVHMGLDDGIEHFGGNAYLKHIVLTGNSDDSLDWGTGWRGKAQYVLIEQASDAGDRGIEADNDPSNYDDQPRSKPLLANMTIIGGSAVGTEGMKLRRGTGANIFNSVVTKFNTGGCIQIDGLRTYQNAGTSATSLSGQLTAEGTYVDCPGKEFNDKFKQGEVVPFTTEQWFRAQPGNVVGDPKLAGIYPAANSPLLTAGVKIADPDKFVDETSYAGAFKDANDNWHTEWSVGLNSK